MTRASHKRQENRSQNQPHKLSLLQRIHQRHPDWSTGKAKDDATNGLLMPNPSNTKVCGTHCNTRPSSSQDQVKGPHTRAALDSHDGRRISTSTPGHTKAQPDNLQLRLRMQGRSRTRPPRADPSSGDTPHARRSTHRLFLNAKTRADSSRSTDNHAHSHSR